MSCGAGNSMTSNNNNTSRSDGSNSISSSSTSLVERAKVLYRGVGLAPMVRASTIPLRTLALNYGANFVYTEELIDRSISESKRVVNETLNTIDYIKDQSLSKKQLRKRQRQQQQQQNGGGSSSSSSSHLSKSLLLRIDRRVEKNKLIFQIGSGEPELALKAALHVKSDVDAIDINMGCPKKFSVSGGMGSALLSDPNRACRIIKTLRDHIHDKPISAKIRLLDGGGGSSDEDESIKKTIDFIAGLVNAGVHAIAIHGRYVGDDCTNPAKWDTLSQVVQIVKTKYPSLPVLLNGDFYTRDEFDHFQQQTKADGVLLARPALYNTSIFRTPPTTTKNDDDHIEQQHDDNNNNDYNDHNTYNRYLKNSKYGYHSPLLINKTTVVQDYLKECIKYDAHYVNVKYVICEMMTNRRTPTHRVPYLVQSNPFGKQTIGKICNCRTLEEMCVLWDVNYSNTDYNNHNGINHNNSNNNLQQDPNNNSENKKNKNNITSNQQQQLAPGEHRYEDAYFLKEKGNTSSSNNNNTSSSSPIISTETNNIQDSTPISNNDGGDNDATITTNKRVCAKE